MTAENRSRDGGNVWMIVLIALALIATVIMLFSDSAVWLQVALLAALWAAICGFLLVSRARNDRDRLRAESESREREYKAEIEALRARSEADHYALEAARAGEGLPPAVDLEVLREIRAELATLRSQLEDLSGREFGYEPAALQAEARRVKEIEARTDRVAPGEQAAQAAPTAQPSQPAQAAAPTRTPQPQQPPQPRPAQPHTQPPKPAQPKPQQQAQAQGTASTRWAPGSTDETSRIKPVRDEDENQAINALRKQSAQAQQQKPQQPKQQAQPAKPQPKAQQAQQPQRPVQEKQQQAASARVHGAPSSDAVAGRVGTHRAPDGRNPLTDLIRERQEELERERQRQEAQRRQREEEARKAEAAAQEVESRGRRRADENRDGALTVAELLARSKKGE